MSTTPAIKSTLANEPASPTYLTTLYSKLKIPNDNNRKFNYDYNAVALKY